MLETLSKTTFNSVVAGTPVHIEQSLQSADRYDGHLVTGHIAGVIYLISTEILLDSSVILRFSLNNAQKYVKYKDGIAIDGVSLTVASVDATSFTVALIPHTQKHTNLLKKNVGAGYNVEFISPVTDAVEIAKDSVDYMDIAIQLSKKGKITAPPNPHVGAVIVDDSGNIIGTGFHLRRGEKHAEANAMAQIIDTDQLKGSRISRFSGPGQVSPTSSNRNSTIMPIGSSRSSTPVPVSPTSSRSSGSISVSPTSRSSIPDSPTSQKDLSKCTLYCTLEPCSSRMGNKIQSPCTDLIINSGVRKVVIGIADPDPRMLGKGVELLKSAGVDAVVLNSERVRNSLRAYLFNRITGKPYVTVKVAISIDGKISGKPNDKWISCEASRKDAHLLRAKNQAILVGTNTVLLDNPMLTVRDTEYNVKPLRCFIDIYGRVKKETLNILDTSHGPVVAFISEYYRDTEMLRNRGIEVIVIKNLNDILTYLASRGVVRLLVEGGAKLITSFFREKLVNELVVYTAPILIGNHGVSMYSELVSFDNLRLVKSKIIDKDVKLRYLIDNSS
jgi:diaminohydroxyphosphoribosylaminopyrimidine deaminase / 5-amino-6-(5-phosphoribosylamino)uracil reductase